MAKSCSPLGNSNPVPTRVRAHRCQEARLGRPMRGPGHVVRLPGLESSQDWGMSDDQRAARARRCSDPSPTVSKQLFGTAVKCARPACNELLYRLENAQPALNCRIAHIRASAPNGPRADPMMTCAEVNAFDNLLLLCLYDAALIDDSWEEYPAEMLFEWKRQQVEQAALLGVAREPTDDEITQLIIESRQLDPLARSASIALARAVRRLRSAAERTRVEPERILQERQKAISQLNRDLLAIDSETGERLQASLSRQEERRYRSRIDEALSHTSVAVEAAAETVLAEAAGVAAATGSACADARAWVERSVGDVVRAASEWPDDLGSALAELDAAATALSEVAAGRTVAVPPAPSPAEPEEPTALEVFFGRCREVHERAVRHARVDHLPFDAALHAEVLSLAGDGGVDPVRWTSAMRARPSERMFAWLEDSARGAISPASSRLRPSSSSARAASRSQRCAASST
jgi:ElaB/YqjD/DUF883 family membrane-anchored ribosome-binding protein